MPLNILLTNDDGYTAPGLVTLYDALTAAGHNVRVAAPEVNQSAQGSTLGGPGAEGRPVAYEEFSPGNYYVEGSPAVSTLVGLDVLDLFGGEQPDVVVSGTNRGENVGESSNISGTVNAAVAALNRGIPAIALSAGSSGGSYDAAYGNGAEFLVGLLDRLEAERAEGGPLIPGGEGLTVEIPGRPDLAGVAVTRITGESSAEYPIVQRPNGLYNSQFTPNTEPSGDPTSQGSQFIDGRLAVSPIDGDWTASDAVRLDLSRRLDGRLGDGSAPDGPPLDILLVNEDGADSPGLRLLRDALLAEGHDVTVAAPAADQSGVGTALTLTDFAVEETGSGYTVAATPSTTVYTALDALLTGEDRPELILSGVDEGTSLGLQGFASASVAAAVAGVFNYGIPSVSVAVDAGEDGFVGAGEYVGAADFAAELVAELQGTAPPSGALLPAGTGLKVNLPEDADPSRVAFTRADASTNARLEAAATGLPGEARIAFGDPVATSDPDAEGNAFAAGDIAITPIDGNYGSGDLGAYDRIASLLGIEFGRPAAADALFA